MTFHRNFRWLLPVMLLTTELIAQPKVHMTAVADKGEIRPYETFEVSVQVDATQQPVVGATAHLMFDPAMLEVIQVTSSQILEKQLASSYDNSKGWVTYAAGTFKTPVNRTFELAKVAFRSIEQTGKVTIAFDTTITQANKTEAAYHGGMSVMGNTLPATVLVVSNKPPVANAGNDITLVAEGSQEVTLNGEASTDEDGEIVLYVWGIAGKEIARGKKPIVTLEKGTATITLTVTDDGGATSSDEVQVTINEPGNTAPVANAGKDQVLTVTKKTDSVTVSLDGTASTDEDGTIDQYLWTMDGKEVATGKTATIRLSTGTYTLLLKVTDNKGLTATDQLQVTVNTTANLPPIADAGDNQVVMDENEDGFEEVTLDGSGSQDEDGSINAYDWHWDLATAIGQKPVVKLAQGRHTVILTVTDDQGAQASDTVIVVVRATSATNQAPVANAGKDQMLTDADGDGYEDMQLDGSASIDADGDIVTFQWAYEGAVDKITGSKPIVRLPVGITTVVLTVTDDQGATASDTVIVTISAKNQAPIAKAGEPQTISDEDGNGQVIVTLDGSASADPDGTITSYTWYDSRNRQIASGASASITLDTGRWTIYLKVTDDQGAIATDSTTITINPATPKPLGIAGNIRAPDVKIYPNPSAAFFTIAFSRHMQCYWSVSNTHGQMLMSQHAASNKIVLDMSRYATGVYYLVIRTDYGQQVYRLVVT